MYYLDTNILIYAIEQHPKYGSSCKKILSNIQSGKRKVACSTLVLVEVISVLKKLNTHIKKKLDIRANIDAILSLPITWLDLNLYVIKRAAEYDYTISGVDYLHVASMEVNNISKIITADKDFEKVDFLKRVDPLKV